MYGIVIVAYNPNMHEFNLKIKRFAQDNRAMIIIVNNGNRLQEIKEKNVFYLNMNENKGIAYAQNVGVDYLIGKGIDLSFLLDQDSNLTTNYFMKMIKKWNEIKNYDSKLAVLAPNVYDVKSKQLLSTRIISNDCKLNIKILNQGDLHNTLPISSGILLDTKIFQKINGNRAAYFIDWVDFQFDLDVIKAGYHVYSTADIKIQHQIGRSEEKIFLGKKVHPTNHSVFRNYYFFRNGIIFLHENKSFKFVRNYVLKALFKRYILVFYEDNRKEKHRAQFKGIRDARKFIKNKKYNI